MIKWRTQGSATFFGEDYNPIIKADTMQTPFLKNRYLLVLLASLLLVVLIYSIDLYKLTFRLKGWTGFGETPVAASQVQYFVADTPDLIGFRDPGTGESVTCGTTVAYVKTAAAETYRCCDTGDRISCLAGDFSREIPAIDENCTGFVSEAFGIPVGAANAMDYRIFGSCPGDSASMTASGVTVTQIDSSGQILWKTVNSQTIDLFTTVFRCVVAPLLVGLVIWIVIQIMRGKRNEPIPKF